MSLWHEDAVHEGIRQSRLCKNGGASPTGGTARD